MQLKTETCKEPEKKVWLIFIVGSSFMAMTLCFPFLLKNVINCEKKIRSVSFHERVFAI